MSASSGADRKHTTATVTAAMTHAIAALNNLKEWENKKSDSKEIHRMADALDDHLKRTDNQLSPADNKQAIALFRRCADFHKYQSDSKEKGLLRKYLKAAAELGDMYSLFEYLDSFTKIEQSAFYLKFETIIKSSDYLRARKAIERLEELKQLGNATFIQGILDSTIVKLIKTNKQLAEEKNPIPKNDLIALAKQNNVFALWRLLKFYLQNEPKKKIYAKIVLCIRILVYTTVDPEKASQHFRVPPKELKPLTRDARFYLWRNPEWKDQSNDYGKLAHWGFRFADALKKLKVDVFDLRFDFDRYALAYLQSPLLKTSWLEDYDVKGDEQAIEDAVVVDAIAPADIFAAPISAGDVEDAAQMLPGVQFLEYVHGYLALADDDLTGSQTILKNYAQGLIDGLGYKNGWHKGLNVTEEIARFAPQVPTNCARGASGEFQLFENGSGRGLSRPRSSDHGAGPGGPVAAGGIAAATRQGSGSGLLRSIKSSGGGAGPVDADELDGGEIQFDGDDDADAFVHVLSPNQSQ